MDTIKLTRKELYDLVWSESMLSITKKYKISDNGLRKICKRFKIPIPYRGYWAKIKYGKPVKVPPFNSNFQSNDLVYLTTIDISDEFAQTPSLLKIRQKEIELDKDIKLTIPERLSRPDPLIRKYKENLTLKKRKSIDYYFDYDNHLSIHVEDNQLNRALLIMDTFIKAIKHRGHVIKVINSATVLIINGENFKVRIRERKKRIATPNKMGWNTYEYERTGILVFVRDGFPVKEWYDGAMPLEDQLSKIIAKLELESDHIKLEREKRRIKWEEDERRKQIELKIKQRKLKELNDFKELLNDAKRWKRLLILREYIDYMEHKSDLTSKEKKDWVKWARDKANWYDPAINLYDELMDEIDKNSLKPSVER